MFLSRSSFSGASRRSLPASARAFVVTLAGPLGETERKTEGAIVPPPLLNRASYFFAGFFGSLGFFVPPQPPHTVLTPSSVEDSCDGKKSVNPPSRGSQGQRGVHS
jgi:hypothetical protein